MLNCIDIYIWGKISTLHNFRPDWWAEGDSGVSSQIFTRGDCAKGCRVWQNNGIPLGNCQEGM